MSVETAARVVRLKARKGFLKFVCCECHKFGATERAIGWRRERHHVKAALLAVLS